jgi:hypothetical protein
MTIGGVIGRAGDSSTGRFFRKVFGCFGIRPLPPGGWLLVAKTKIIFGKKRVALFGEKKAFLVIKKYIIYIYPRYT